MSLFDWLIKRSLKLLRYDGFLSLLWQILQPNLSPLGSLKLVTFYQKDLTQPLKEVRPKVDVTVSQDMENQGNIGSFFRETIFIWCIVKIGQRERGQRPKKVIK
jgi:hypothetical protein